MLSNSATRIVARTYDDSDRQPLSRGLIHPIPRSPREELQQEGEDATAVVDEVEKGEEGQREASKEMPDLGTEFGRIGRDRATALLQKVGDSGYPG